MSLTNSNWRKTHADDVKWVNATYIHNVVEQRTVGYYKSCFVLHTFATRVIGSLHNPCNHITCLYIKHIFWLISESYKKPLRRCIFFGKVVQKLKRHILSHHKSHPDVIGAANKDFIKIRDDGIYEENKELANTEKPSFILQKVCSGVA